MYPTAAYTATSRAVTIEDTQSLLKDLNTLTNFTGFQWLLSADPEPGPQEFPTSTLDTVMCLAGFLHVTTRSTLFANTLLLMLSRL